MSEPLTEATENDRVNCGLCPWTGPIREMWPHMAHHDIFPTDVQTWPDGEWVVIVADPDPADFEAGA